MPKSKTELQEINKKIELIDTRIFELTQNIEFHNSSLLALLGFTFLLLITLVTATSKSLEQIVAILMVVVMIGFLIIGGKNYKHEKKVTKLLREKRNLIEEKYKEK